MSLDGPSEGGWGISEHKDVLKNKVLKLIIMIKAT
jgi:hypothetical protein